MASSSSSSDKDKDKNKNKDKDKKIDEDFPTPDILFDKNNPSKPIRFLKGISRLFRTHTKDVPLLDNYRLQYLFESTMASIKYYTEESKREMKKELDELKKEKKEMDEIREMVLQMDHPGCSERETRITTAASKLLIDTKEEEKLKREKIVKEKDEEIARLVEEKEQYEMVAEKKIMQLEIELEWWKCRKDSNPPSPSK